MSLAEILNMLPGPPVLSGAIGLVVAVVLLYLARGPAHKAIYSIFRVLHGGFRLAARSMVLAAEKVAKRNKEVLLTAGAESQERLIEREFQRVDAVVKRDLGGYPTLHRTLTDQLARIEDDYRETSEVPLPPPEWVKAVDTLAKLPSKGDSWVSNILGDVHKTAVSQYKNSMEEYRKAVGSRHALLEKMRPYWRKLSDTLGEVNKTISGLQQRAKVIDNRIGEYEEIRKKTDKAARTLTSSAMTQFFISGFVLLIAIGGAVINFNLIALPMSEMVGGGSYIGSFKTSDIAALVIILVEVAMGLYLMESLRITGLFPVIGQMDDKMRTRMIWVTFSILLVLACVESALAFMRDRIALDMQALRMTLANVEAPHTVNSWIPTVGQMVLGFILPFALTFVAIPLESFVQSSRTVMGEGMGALLRGLAFLLRLLGNVSKYTGDLLVNLYDLLAFPLVWVENLLRNKPQPTKVKRSEMPEMITKEEMPS